MKTRVALIFSIVIFLFLTAGLRQADTDAVAKKASTVFLDQKKVLENKIIDLSVLLNSAKHLKEINSDSIKKKLLACRMEYKKMEWAMAYYYPSVAVRINGTDVMEEEENAEFEPPHGLQTIENIALGGDSLNEAQKLKLKDELAHLRITVNSMSESISLLSGSSNSEMLAALKYEIIKVTAMGLTEYDNPVMRNYLDESVTALISVRDNLKLFRQSVSPALIDKTDKLFASASDYIKKHNDIDKFNRMEFILNHFMALSHLVDDYAAEMKITYSSYNPCIDLQAKSIFDLQSFSYFFNDDDKGTHAARVALGRNLFFDPVLSGNCKRACASCHKPGKSFTDGLSKSAAFDENQSVSRNSPTLINSCLQVSFFDDSRQASFETQLSEVVNNPNELNSNFALIISRLEQSKEYLKMFNDAFPGESITANHIKKAIADYERTLVSFNSDFDKYMRGEKKKLTASQINGFNLFMGKAKCGSCHFLPLFNGMLPPLYNKSEFEIIGALQTNDFENPHLDADEGVGPIKKADHLKFGFKVPTLRNAALTAPYMHNGAMKTLQDVLTFYNKGGGASFSQTVPNQTLSRDSLGLSKQQMNDIIHFIESLSDTTGLTSMPHVLPRLLRLNARVSGGEY